METDDRVKRLQLALDRGILVDPQDQWLLEEYTWTIAEHGYPVRAVNFDGRWAPTYLHHYIVGQPIWYNDEIDHRNRIKLDNRRDNLWYRTHSQNLINNNQPVGASGVRGVTPLPNGSYMAQIKRKGIRHYLGCYGSVEEAADARNRWIEINC